jgi:hypothetical protein
MSDIDRPSYCNHAWWIQHFEDHREDEQRFLIEWRDEARALIAARGKARKLGSWWDMTTLLVAWCDQHPEVKMIDPTAFQVLSNVLWKKFHGGKGGSACHEALETAMHPFQRLQIANEIQNMRLKEALFKKKLTDAEALIAKFLDGASGPQNVKAIHSALRGEVGSRETISRLLGEGTKLWARGYRLAKGEKGYQKQIV